MILSRNLRPRRAARAPRPPAADATGTWLYARLGHGARRLALLPGGIVGEGAAGLERWWTVEVTADGPTLVLGAARPTARMRLGGDGVWRGRWLVHEAMPVELRPIPAPEVAGPPIREAVARAMAAAPSPTWTEPRGIVVCAGGSRLLTCAWVLVSRLRALGCALPVELWALGAVEAGPGVRRLFADLGVEVVDARQDPEGARLPAWSTWAIKAVAVARTRFREALLLDADNVPLRDPSFLFDHPEARRAGALFWPDFGRFAADHPAWRLLGLPPVDEAEQESGQLWVDRARCARALAATLALNHLGREVYQYVHGDKDTWRLGWRLAGRPYAMIPHPVGALPGVMVQHAPDGEPLFQHRNLQKWSLDEPNPPVPGFADEPACLEAIAALRGRWDGIPCALAELPAPLRDEVAALVGPPLCFVLPGFSRQALRFGPDHRVVEGAGPLARRWYAGEDGDAWALVIEGDRGPTARLRWTGPGRWTGAWPGYPGVEAQLETTPGEGPRTRQGPRARVVPVAPFGPVAGPPVVASASRHLRGRGDRPGFEPRDPGPLPAPDRPPGSLVLADRSGPARRLAWRGPLWDGSPVERLVVDLGGGLGDVVRWLPLLQAVRREGRVRTIVARVHRDPAWFADRLPGVEVVPAGVTTRADAGLPAIHALPRHRWTRWPAAPLTALAARALALPLTAAAGPCLRWEDEGEAVREQLRRAGWAGEPLVAVQGDATEPLARWRGTFEFRRAKFAPDLPEVARRLRASGAFLIWIGTPGPPDAERGALDLRGAPLGILAGAVGVADLVLAVDSGPAHLAGVIGTPVVAVFGPSDPALHACAAGTVAVLPEPGTCAQLPCGAGSLIGQPQTPRGWVRPIRCPAAGPCLHRLDVDALSELARRVLAYGAPPSPPVAHASV